MHPAIRANLEQLKGFTVTSIEEEPDTDICPPMAILIFQKVGTGKIIEAYISQDEEGNGPGHLMLSGDVDPKISF